jgi:hypothetical protein
LSSPKARRFEMTKVITHVSAAVLMLALAAPALASSARELPTLQDRSPRHDVTPRADAPVPLSAGTYTARLFPIPLRVAVPAGWRGGQGRAHQAKEPGVTFGWIELSQGTAARAQGAITIVTSAGSTPSVAAVVARLRRGHGATYGPVTHAKLAGFTGSQFDGSIEGQGHVFVPFTPRQRVASFYSDAFAFDAGETFRISVIDVRGKTVVVFVESAALRAERFPAFLSNAEHVLGSLRLPR